MPMRRRHASPLAIRLTGCCTSHAMPAVAPNSIKTIARETVICVSPENDGPPKILAALAFEATNRAYCSCKMVSTTLCKEREHAWSVHLPKKKHWSLLLARDAMCASDRGGALMRHRLTMLACVAALLAAPVQASEPTDGYFTTSDGIKIHYLTQGAVGSWVVLIHGYTGNAQGNWFDNGVAPALAKKQRVVALDCSERGKAQ